MRVLVTGAAGFIGSFIVQKLLNETDWEIVCIDKLTYSSFGWKRLKDSGVYNSDRVKCVTWDLVCPINDYFAEELGDINIIIHMAAETHVDNSIANPVGCIHNNVMSTVQLLEYARKLKNLKCFQYFSTDEVYGCAPKGVAFKETDQHNSKNPYSASKAASEMVCLSYENTYKIPIIITNLMNCIQIRQHPEKMVIKTIKTILNGGTINIHTESDGKTPGTRFYINAYKVADAVLFILRNGKVGERYHITGEREVDNLTLAKIIAKHVGKPLCYNLVSHHESRPGHDNRYSLDGSKLKQLGWEPHDDFDNLIKEIVDWTLKHPEWLEE